MDKNRARKTGLRGIIFFKSFLLRLVNFLFSILKANHEWLTAKKVLGEQLITQKSSYTELHHVM